MTELEDIPEPDRVEAAPHPRHTSRLLGQEAAETAFLRAFGSGRLHHAWLVTGPRGVGKATLAWRLARFLLATPGDASPPATLDIAADHPVARRVAALSEPRLFLLRRPWDPKRERLRAEITVDEVRKLKDFFGLTATDGGRRVVILDAAEEMNPSAANALLKLLEEPPAGALLLLVCHQPSRLLPTIRSRCRELRCAALGPADLADAMAAAGAEPGPDADRLAELSGGSVGEALRLEGLGGLDRWDALAALMGGLPALDRPRAIAFAEAAAKDGEAAFDLTLRLASLFLSRLARTGSGHPPQAEALPGEAALLARLAPTPAAARRWAEAEQGLTARARRGKAVNLDPAALILDMVLRINETAAATTASNARP